MILEVLFGEEGGTVVHRLSVLVGLLGLTLLGSLGGRYEGEGSDPREATNSILGGAGWGGGEGVK